MNSKFFVATSVLFVVSAYIVLSVIRTSSIEYHFPYLLSGLINFCIFLVSFFVLFVILKKKKAKRLIITFYISIISRFFIFLIFVLCIFILAKDEGKDYLISYLVFFLLLLKVEVFFIYREYR